MSLPATQSKQDDWDDHWDAFADAAASNPAQEYRRRLTLALLERGGRPARLLDIGSGQGDLLEAATHRWPNVEMLGIEVSASGIHQAQAKVPDARFLQRDLLTAQEATGEYVGWATHAVCSEVLEHVDEPTVLLANARAFLRVGCRLVVTVPGGRMSAFDHHIGHRRHYTPATLSEQLSAAGFDVEMAVRAGFPFFNLYRAMIIARGARLVEDVAARPGQRPTLLARAAMQTFRPLFRLNLPHSRWGIQIVGVAHVPA
jgi:trans-aconitate methyltransferase